MNTLYCILFSFFLFTSINAQNYSLHFDGTDDFVHIPSTDIFLGDNFTIEGWVKSESTQIQSIFLAFPHLDQLGSNIAIQLDNGRIRASYRPVYNIAGPFELISSGIVADGTWHHFAFVKSSRTGISLYVDGALQINHPAPIANISQGTYIELGKNKNAVAENFRILDGYLDDVKVWNYAKNTAQINADLMSESHKDENYLYSNYKFDDPDHVGFDCSSEARHGTLDGQSGNNNNPQLSVDRPSLDDVPCEINTTTTNNNDSKATYEIFPNPTRQFIQIKSSKGITPQAFDIFSTAGQLLSRYWTEGQFIQVDISNLPSGSYLLIFDFEGERQVEPFIVQLP